MHLTAQTKGVTIPLLALGTLRSKGEDAARLVELAVGAGYRHIDTAEFYGNEDGVGQGIARVDVPRDEIWVTTKILHPKAPPAPSVRAAAIACLQRLGLDYVDALLIHWPNPAVPLEEAIGTMAALREEGLVRSTGVSNFPTALLDAAADLDPLLVLNQVEFHPYLDQGVVNARTRHHGMLLGAHTPLAQGRITDDALLTGIAAAHGASPAQVVLAWMLAKGDVVPVPGGSVPGAAHLAENVAAQELTLTDGELAAIDALGGDGRLLNPPHAPTWDA